MSDLSIRVKITGLIVCAAIVIGAVGYIGITNIHTIDDADTFLFEKTTVPLGQLCEISSKFQRIRSLIRDAIFIAKTPLDVENYHQMIKNESEKISKACEGYQKTFIDKTDEEIYNSGSSGLSVPKG